MLMRIANVGLATLGTLPGVRILDLAGRNAVGVGRLQRAADGLVSWRAPGSRTAGPAVDVSAGGTFLLRDGDDADAWLEIEATSAWLAAGPLQQRVEVVELWNTALAGDDVTDVQRKEGLTASWTLDLHDAGGAGLSVTLWLDIYGARYHLLSDSGGVGSWIAPVTPGAGLAIGIAAGGTASLHVRRVIPEYAPPSPLRRVRLHWYADDGAGHTESGTAVGLFRIFSQAVYLVYKAQGRTPVAGSDAPWALGGALPITPDEVLDDGLHTLALTRHNGLLESYNGPLELVQVTGGARVMPPPREPRDLLLIPVADGVMRVAAGYPGVFDGPARRATHWALWTSTSGPPNGAGAAQHEVPVTLARGYAQLRFDLPAIGDGLTQHVLVKMLRRVTAQTDVYSSAAPPAACVALSSGPSAPRASGLPALGVQL